MRDLSLDTYRLRIFRAKTNSYWYSYGAYQFISAIRDALSLDHKKHSVIEKEIRLDDNSIQWLKKDID